MVWWSQCFVWDAWNLPAPPNYTLDINIPYTLFRLKLNNCRLYTCEMLNLVILNGYTTIFTKQVNCLKILYSSWIKGLDNLCNKIMFKINSRVSGIFTGTSFRISTMNIIAVLPTVLPIVMSVKDNSKFRFKEV